MPRLGTRKLHGLMQAEPELTQTVGRDRLFAILRDNRQLVPRKRAYHKTTDSHHRFRRHPNRLKPGPDQVTATGPEQVWVADITYLPTQQSVAYVSLVTDAYSRKIVGHHVHETLHTESVIQAMNKALRNRRTDQALVHHSDRGSQGGFNRSSQHLDRGVYGAACRLDAKVNGTWSDAFARCTVTS